MRLIDADVLIQAIDPMYIAKKGIVSDTFAEGCIQFEKLIKEQPTINQWIPTSERLPQASKHILFSVKGKSYTSYGFYNDGIWTDINGAWYTDKEVNAWIPLPKPYKEMITVAKNATTTMGVKTNDNIN